MNETNSTSVMAVSDYIEYKASVLVWNICSPILIIVGSIGNLMSILVLTRTNMRKSTMSIYLTVLSIADILVLYTGLLRQVIRYHTDLDLRSLSPLSCKINTWMVYFTLDMSVWLLVAVTVERTISVCLPHRVRYTCSAFTSSITIIVIAIVLLSVNSHFLYGIGETVNVVDNSTVIELCQSLWDDYEHFMLRVWPWVDLCFFCLIPFTILIIGNISIIVKVCSSKKNRAQHTNRLTTTVNSQQVQAYNKKTSSMTAMLLCVNIVFLVCTSPISVYLIGEPYWVGEHLTNHGKAQHSLIWAVVNILMYTNNSINFILYCVSGTRFREELKNIFRKTNRIRPQGSFTRAPEQMRGVTKSNNEFHTTNTKTDIANPMSSQKPMTILIP